MQNLTKKFIEFRTFDFPVPPNMEVVPIHFYDSIPAITVEHPFPQPGPTEVPFKTKMFKRIHTDGPEFLGQDFFVCVEDAEYAIPLLHSIIESLCAVRLSMKGAELERQINQSKKKLDEFNELPWWKKLIFIRNFTI